MRIGTWNLEGRWSTQHRDVLVEHRCDLWLLTEVAAGTRLPGYAAVTTQAEMLPGKAWAAVLSRRSLEALPDPHAASAAGLVDGLVVCSSVLPWRGSGNAAPWVGDGHAARTAAAVDELAKALPAAPLVWGGDFNHALEGPEVAGSADGAASVLRLLEARHVRARTVGLAHRLPDVKTIDHIAVPAAWPVTQACHVPTAGLSDHDIYVVEGRRSGG